MWSKLAGQDDVTVSPAYVPAFEPVVFAMGLQESGWNEWVTG